MIKERLQTLSLEKLQEVAKGGNISFYPEMDRDQLVELILDSLAEEQEEKDAMHNMAIKIEAKKFNAFLMEELYIDYDEELVLPEKYNETKMVFMPRDPSWGFLYWDLENKTKETLQANENYKDLFIRVYQLEDDEEREAEASEFFDIPIQFGDRRRYINLPENDSWYRAEIRVLVGERESVIVRSNSIKTSREFIMPSSEEDHKNSDLLIELSGFTTDFGNFSGKHDDKKISHRVFPYSTEEDSE